MAKCSNCGKVMYQGYEECNSETGKYYWLCKDCYNATPEGQEKKKKEYERQRRLSIPELQLQEIKQMKKDVSTIKDIMLFYLFLFLISLIITIISVLMVI